MVSIPDRGNDKKLLKELEKDINSFVNDNLPQLNQNEIEAKGEKIIRDGLWGTLKIDPTELCYIDTPLLQRLRKIHQTGFTFLTYPTSNHSRFEHTLGVMSQIQKLGEALLQNKINGKSEKRLSPQDIQNSRYAALFHDIGHGPFSHSSEMCISLLPHFPAFKRTECPGKNPRAHEIISYYIVKSKRFESFTEQIEDATNIKIPIDPIANSIIGCDNKSLEPFKVELLNGPFDSDKIDYLSRDSHFTGLPMSLDIDRLWYKTRIGKVKGKNHLVVLLTAATCLEQIFFSRMLLFSTVYHHQKIRACDCMFLGIFEYMKQKDISVPFRDNNIKFNKPSDFLKFNDYEFLSLASSVEDKGLKGLINNINNRRLLKRCLVINKKTLKPKSKKGFIEPLSLAVDDNESAFLQKRDLAEKILKKSKVKCLTEEIWVDLPEPPSNTIGDDAFLISSDKAMEEPIPLNEIFPIDTWADDYRDSLWRGHVFCPPEHIEQVKSAAKKVLEDELGCEILDNAFHWCKVEPPRKRKY